MGLGNNRDYKISARAVKTNLDKHYKRMSELINQGLGREAASKQAFDELTARKVRAAAEAKS